MNEQIKYVSDVSFETDVLKPGKPAPADLWIGWHGPYKMIIPVLDGVSKDHSEKVQIAEINVDENQGVPAKFDIRDIPTLILFKNGTVVTQRVGALSKSQLTAFLSSHL